MNDEALQLLNIIGKPVYFQSRVVSFNITNAIISGDRVWNVKAYGAKGDGTTDNTSSIQNTINAAHTAGGGIVYIPKGIYISSPLILYSNVGLAGAGRFNSILKAKVGSVGNFLAWTGLDNFCLLDLTVDGNNTSVNLVEASTGNLAIIQKCAIQNTNGYGVVLSGRSDVDFSQNHVENIGGSGGVVNFVGPSDPRPSGQFFSKNTFKNVSSVTNRPASISCGRCDFVHIEHNTFISCDGGIANEHSKYQTISGNIFTGCRDSLRVGPSDAPGVGEQVDHYASLTDNVITGGTILGAAGITIQGNHVSLVGNIVSACTGIGIAIQSSKGGYTTGFTAKNIIMAANKSNGNGLDGISIGSDVSYSGTGIVSSIEAVGNDVSGNSRYGISINESTSGDIQEMIIALNNCLNNGTAGIGGSYPGTLQTRQSLHFFKNSGVVSGLPQIPAVPASGTPYTNPYGADVTAFVSGGVVSAINVAGQSTGLTSGAFRVPVGQTITLTYTSAPSILWILD
jgi:hypothetical protein